MFIKTISDSGTKIHSYYKDDEEKNKDNSSISKFPRLDLYHIIKYIKCTSKQDNDMYNSISNLKNLELQSLTNPNIQECKTSLIENGFVLIPVTKQEQNEFFDISKQIFEYHNPEDLQKTQPADDIPQSRLLDIDSSFKVTQQLSKFINDLTQDNISLSGNSHFQLNTIATKLHVDIAYNFIFSFTSSPKNIQMPRTKYLPIKFNNEFEPIFMENSETKEKCVVEYKLKENSNLDIESELVETPVDNAILFLGGKKLSNSPIADDLDGKQTHHKAPNENNDRVNMTIRFIKQN